MISDWQIDWCTDVLSGHAHLSYSLDSSGSVVDPGSSDPCLAFKLFAIPNSNLYVIIYRPTSACQTPQVIVLHSLKSNLYVIIYRPTSACQTPQVIEGNGLHCSPSFELYIVSIYFASCCGSKGGGYIERKVMEIYICILKNCSCLYIYNVHVLAS